MQRMLRSRRRLLPVGFAAVACLGAIAPAAGGAESRPLAAAAVSCQSLHPPADLRSEMLAAYRRASGLPSSVALTIGERIKYGRCGATRYAWGLPAPSHPQALTEQEQIAAQDHSPLFRQLHGHKWVEFGVGPLCGPGPLPRAMARAWHLACD